MKICHFLHENKKYQGVFNDGRVYPLPGKDIPESLDYSLLKESFEAQSVKFLIPVSPSKIVCVGGNYAAHAAELGNEIPKSPLLFLKAPSALINDGETITIPEQSSQVEHEGELGIVIGRECRRLNETDDPFEYVLGYVCLNDVTARDIQRREVQFTRAKSFDTFCPVGSFIETE